jgi:YD repeat-containing protein
MKYCKQLIICFLVLNLIILFSQVSKAEDTKDTTVTNSVQENTYITDSIGPGSSQPFVDYAKYGNVSVSTIDFARTITHPVISLPGRGGMDLDLKLVTKNGPGILYNTGLDLDIPYIRRGTYYITRKGTEYTGYQNILHLPGGAVYPDEDSPFKTIDYSHNKGTIINDGKTITEISGNYHDSAIDPNYNDWDYFPEVYIKWPKNIKIKDVSGKMLKEERITYSDQIEAKINFQEKSEDKKMYYVTYVPEGKTTILYNQDGSEGKAITYQYRYDDWGNVIWEKDPMGTETYMAYANTDSNQSLSTINSSYKNAVYTSCSVTANLTCPAFDDKYCPRFDGIAGHGTQNLGVGGRIKPILPR